MFVRETRRFDTTVPSLAAVIAGAARRATVVLLVLLTSGCALTNPHVRWEPPAQPKCPQDASCRPVSLAYAIQYAEAAKVAYQKSLDDQARFHPLLGLGLIPLAAATVGLGVTGGAPVAITALSLTGATAYGSAVWLGSRPAQRAYVAGYNATVCAIDAVTPLQPVEANLKEHKDRQETLATQMAAVAKAIAELRNLVEPEPPKVSLTLITTARKTVTAAEQALAVARETSGKADELIQHAAMAGGSLKQAVDRISGQVSGALVENAPDLQTLSALITGLAQYRQFAAVPPQAAAAPTTDAAGSAQSSAVPGTPEAKIEEDIQKKIIQLDAAVLAMNATATRVAAFVNSVAASKQFEKLKACGVNPDDVATGLVIDPGAVNFTEGKPESAGFIIQGGASPYHVALQADGVEGLSVRQTGVFGPAFVAQTSAKTPANTYQVYVSDRSGRHKFAKIVVTKATTTPAGDALDPKALLKSKTDDLQTRLVEDDKRFVTVGTHRFKILSGPDVVADTQTVTLSVLRETDKAQAVSKEELRKALLAHVNKIAVVYGAKVDLIKGVTISNEANEAEVGKLGA